jgi:hypothetical protein
MFRKVLLSVVAAAVLILPVAVGAHHYYADSGYYSTTYETREVSEYVPYKKYVCDESHYSNHNDYGYYGYGYQNHRNCYYQTDYRLETKTVRVPVQSYINTTPTYNYSNHTRRVYDVPTYNSYNRNYNTNNTYYPRNTRNVVEYYGYYYNI